jgi:hypothetical protein
MEKFTEYNREMRLLNRTLNRAERQAIDRWNACLATPASTDKKKIKQAASWQN